MHEQDGRWTLDGPWLVLRPFYFQDWPSIHVVDREATFYLTDYWGPELNIFGGGSPDPDCWQIWSRVEAERQPESASNDRTR
ncbi:MAG: hypothetical protein IPJ77_15435 [Planctomycetes bacterium]|nr:hypothetical protein [Planctomycetota bacterium]